MGDPSIWEAIARTAAMFAGIGLAIALIGSVIHIWIKKQVFGAGGLALCIFGVVLIGLSVWQSVELSLPGANLKLVEETGRNVAIASKESADAAKAADDAKVAVAGGDKEKAQAAADKAAKAAQAATVAAQAAQHSLSKVRPPVGHFFFGAF